MTIHGRVLIAETLTKSIDVQEWQELLDYTGFDQLKGRYKAEDIYISTITTVYFSDGKKKTVHDFDPLGSTFGLRAIYEKFVALMRYQDWKLKSRHVY